MSQMTLDRTTHVRLPSKRHGSAAKGIQAHNELAAVEASGEPKVISHAQEKERVMSFARSSNSGMARLDELGEYFERSHVGIQQRLPMSCWRRGRIELVTASTDTHENESNR
jgi:hypothetical protein